MFKKVFFILLPFVYLFILLFQQEKAFTQDLGRHIKTGEIIAHCLCVPKVNLYSYTDPNFPFINHHWLSEVIFYEVSALFGLNSIILLKVLVIFASFVIIWLIAYRRAGPFWTCIVSIPYLALFSYRFDVRPEIFSFLFITLFVVLIEKYRQTRNVKFLIPLPFVELLWVNLHIYFVVGILILGALLVSEFIQRKKLNIPILLIFAAAVFSTLLNPNGINGSLLPFTILQHYGYSIVENQNIFFLNSILPSMYIDIFEILVVVCILLLLFSKIKDWYIIFLFLGTAVLGAYMVRNFPIFVLSTFPYVVLLAKRISDKLEVEMRKIVQCIVLIAVLLFFLVSSRYLLQSPIRGFSYYSGYAQAVDFFESNRLKGPIFNNFDIGSYLIYRLYPQQRVYVDGRPEAYSVEFFDEYKKMQEDQSEFVKQDAKYHFQTIIFSHTDLTPWAQTFLASMVKNPNWVPVYLDQSIVIFVKNDIENKMVIERYKVTL